MSTIAQQLDRIRTNVANSFNTVISKGGSVIGDKVSDNLAVAISTIPQEAPPPPPPPDPDAVILPPDESVVGAYFISLARRTRDIVDYFYIGTEATVTGVTGLVALDTVPTGGVAGNRQSVELATIQAVFYGSLYTIPLAVAGFGVGLSGLTQTPTPPPSWERHPNSYISNMIPTVYGQEFRFVGNEIPTHHGFRGNGKVVYGAGQTVINATGSNLQRNDFRGTLHFENGFLGLDASRSLMQGTGAWGFRGHVICDCPPELLGNSVGTLQGFASSSSTRADFDIRRPGFTVSGYYAAEYVARFPTRTAAPFRTVSLMDTNALLDLVHILGERGDTHFTLSAIDGEYCEVNPHIIAIAANYGITIGVIE